MDAHAHLLSLGWAGPGHSLDSRPHKGRRGLAYDPKQAQNTGNGLIKPLLISQKRNTFGIGKKAHEPAAGNQWWLKGFETALSNVGKSESERTSGTATPENRRPANGYTGKHGGLYAFFVKGGEMEGTIGLDVEEKDILTRRKKRKSDVLDSQGESSNPKEDEERGSEKKERPKSKDGMGEFEQVGAFLQVRDKDEKRRQRKQKATAFEEFQQVSEFFEARSSRKKAPSSGPPHIGTSQSAADLTLPEVAEDAEQERGRRKKERKAAKITKALQAAPEKTDSPAPMTGSVDDDQRVGNNADVISTVKTKRKVEKKHKKELERD